MRLSFIGCVLLRGARAAIVIAKYHLWEPAHYQFLLTESGHFLSPLIPSQNYEKILAKDISDISVLCALTVVLMDGKRGKPSRLQHTAHYSHINLSVE